MGGAGVRDGGGNSRSHIFIHAPRVVGAWAVRPRGDVAVPMNEMHGSTADYDVKYFPKRDQFSFCRRLV